MSRLALVFPLLAVVAVAPAVELAPDSVADRKGTGADGKGNTADDDWQFWFELAHKPGTFERLDTHSTAVPKAGVPRKITGPIASLLPNPDDTEGWIFHSDWDGRFEGVWADKKAKCVYLYPYVEKRFHGAVAITHRIPEDGTFTVSGTLTDAQVNENDPHDGVEWRLELAEGGKPGRRVAGGGPIGDGKGRPNSDTIAVKDVKAKKGELLRLVVHPRKWWGTDLTRLDGFKVEPVKK